MDPKDYCRQRMQDPRVAAAQRQLQPKLDLGRQILHLRHERGWTQKELAERVGTKQANISRLENGLLNPSVDMLQRVAKALGAELTVTLTIRHNGNRWSSLSQRRLLCEKVRKKNLTSGQSVV